jgi:hypothetical protein
VQISLKGLFVFIAATAFVFGCAAYAGFDNAIFCFSAGVIIILTALFVLLATRQHQRGLASCLAVLAAVIGFALISITIFIDAVILVVGGLLFAARATPPSGRSVSIFAIVALMISCLVGILPGVAEVRRIKEMRREFPIVSLEHRLQYEVAGRRNFASITPVLSVSVSKRLDGFETNLERHGFRQDELRLLHERSYEAFVRAQGFGVGRMMRPTLEDVRLPALQDIRFDELDAHPSLGINSAFELAGKSNDIEHIHFASRDDFLDPEWIGVVLANRKQTIGFVEHAFHFHPAQCLKDRQWLTIDRLELVSLLRFGDSRVYVLDHLPRMDQLSGESVPTRPLDDFESSALAKLRADEDVVVTHQEGNYRMLGSLRAANQCLQCHAAERGELLGALSYSIRDGSASE